MAQKKFKELNLKNAFLFAAAMEDREICRMVLEMILDRPIPLVNVHSEHSLLFSSEFKSIRLDVYAGDEMQVGYNLEMQNKDEKNLAKRSRYHQAEMDANALKPGESFSDLQPSYVIFICTFDPFHKKLYRYTFEERCIEGDFPLGDGTCKIFLNTKGENAGEVPKVLVNFLKYVEDSSDTYVEQIEDKKIAELHGRIHALKKSREWEGRYMTFGELLEDSEQSGIAKGIEQGESRVFKLIAKMAENGETELIPQLENDRELLNRMYEKYNL